VRVAWRRALTDEQRDGVVRRLSAGDRSTLLGAPRPRLLDLYASAGHGLVMVEQDVPRDTGFTPDEARQVAAALLMLADHAEFGPGEFDASGVWRSAVGPDGERVSGYEADPR
jgi:hypothetical protein